MRTLISNELSAKKALNEQMKQMVSKKDIETMMPNISQMEASFQVMVRQSKQDTEEMLMSLVKSLDARLVSLRQETNMESFDMKMKKKADKDYIERTLCKM